MPRFLAAIFCTVALCAAPAAHSGKPSGGGSTTSYTGQNLGALPGENYSDAWDVNDQGSVVGRSYGGAPRAVYWNGGNIYDISPGHGEDESEALAVSGGPTEYAVGWERFYLDHGSESYALLWISPPSVPMLLDDQRQCQALGINHAGTRAVGTCSGTGGVIWSLGGVTIARSDIALLPGFDWGFAQDINDGNIAVGIQQRQSPFLQTGYLRFPDGQVIQLAPAAGDKHSQPMAVSEVQAAQGKQIVYVAGSTHATDNWSDGGRAIRWTVDVGARSVSSVVLNQAWAQGVDRDGSVAGTANTTSRRGAVTSQTGSLWRSGTYIPLKPPQGGSDSAVRGMAPGGGYVVGTSNTSGRWTATLWVVK